MRFPVFSLAGCLLLGACDGEDPELVRKRDQQRLEIRNLEAEVAILQERFKELPPDRSEELAKLKAASAANREEIAGLEAEIDRLEQEKAKVEEEFASYRRKYVVR